MLQRFVHTEALGRLKGVIVQAQFIERYPGPIMNIRRIVTDVFQNGCVQLCSEAFDVHRLQCFYKTRTFGIRRLQFHKPAAGRHIVVFVGAVNTQKVLVGRITVNTLRDRPGMLQHLLPGEARVHPVHQKAFSFSDAGEHLSDKIGIVPVVIV